MAGRLEGLARLVRSGLTREELPPEPAQESASSRPSRFRALFSRDALPLEPERKRNHRNWLAFLFAPERLDPPGGAGTEVH